MRKYGSYIGYVLFFIYLGIMVYLLFFSEMFGRTGVSRNDYSYNLVPFREITRFIKYRKSLGFVAVFLNLAGNVLAFVPFGIFVPKLFKQVGSIITVGINTLAFSAFIEVVQLMFRVGSFDVDDVILNTLGGVLGALIYVLFLKKKQ